MLLVGVQDHPESLAWRRSRCNLVQNVLREWVGGSVDITRVGCAKLLGSYLPEAHGRLERHIGELRVAEQYPLHLLLLHVLKTKDLCGVRALEAMSG